MPIKPTDEFQYLSVLISIVLGLGVTQVLTGVGRLVQIRDRLRVYWPVVAWAIVLLVVHIQSWWAMFELRDHQPWTFPKFLVVLLTPTSLYLMSALLLPDPSEAADGPVDLQQHFYRQSRWFFGSACSVILASLLRPVVLDGRAPRGADLWFQLVFLALAAIAAVTRRRRFHESMALGMVLLYGLYVGTLFVRLR